MTLASEHPMAPASAASSRLADPLVRRLRPYTTTIFAEMSALATATGSINLGQGFPDTDGPASLLAAAQQAIADGVNQYPPGPGIPALRQAIAAARLRDHGQRFDPDTEVLVTVGATEALAAAVLGLCEPGDEVLMLEPHYDSYPPIVAMAGGTHRSVPLRPDATGRFALDVDELAAAVGPRTRMLILNTPHNPTGTVLTRDELAGVAAVAVRHDLIVVTDEVYEYLVYRRRRAPPARHLRRDGRAHGHHFQRRQDVQRHRLEDRLGLRSGAADRRGPGGQAVPHLRRRRAVPAGRRRGAAYRDGLGRRPAGQPAGQAGPALRRARGRGFRGLPAAGHLLRDDRHPAARRRRRHAVLPRPAGRAGVVAVPDEVFHDDPRDGKPFVRFAFCKRDDVIDEAVRRLGAMR